MKINIKAVIVKDNRIRCGLQDEDHKARVKNSISKIGIKHPILLNDDKELVNGFLRLSIYKELHEEERGKLRYIESLPDEKERGMLIKKFGEFIYERIPYEIISSKDEIEDLKKELLETWYMREFEGYRVSTALDRLNILYDDEDKFFLEIEEHLKVSKLEIESFLKIGRDIRNGGFTHAKVVLYKQKSITNEALYDVEEYSEQIEEALQEKIEMEEFDLEEWL